MPKEHINDLIRNPPIDLPKWENVKDQKTTDLKQWTNEDMAIRINNRKPRWKARSVYPRKLLVTYMRSCYQEGEKELEEVEGSEEEK